jgi:hypothetical protein
MVRTNLIDSNVFLRGLYLTIRRHRDVLAMGLPTADALDAHRVLVRASTPPCAGTRMWRGLTPMGAA